MIDGVGSWVQEEGQERREGGAGEKEISLTGFLSCTIDSMESGGRERKTRVEGGMWDKGWKGKGRQLMRFIYNK